MLPYHARSNSAGPCHDKAKVKRYRAVPPGRISSSNVFAQGISSYKPRGTTSRWEEELSRYARGPRTCSCVHTHAVSTRLSRRALISEASSATLNESPITRVINQDRDSDRRLVKNYTCTNATLDLWDKSRIERHFYTEWYHARCLFQ